jgi:hypothetical protein
MGSMWMPWIRAVEEPKYAIGMSMIRENGEGGWSGWVEI